eukprot:COSAG06_NODE_3119_length_5828_cov_3.289754_4_plen_194_part_00
MQKVVLLRAGRRLRPLLLGTRVAPEAATLRAAPRLRSGMIFMCTLTALESIYRYNRERLCSEIQMFCDVTVVTGWRRRCCGRRRQGAHGEWRRRRPQHRTQCFQSRRRLVRNVPIVLKFRFCFDCFVRLSRAWQGKKSFVFVKTSTNPLGWLVISGLRRQHGFCLQLVELAEALVAAEPTSRRGAVRFLSVRY